MDKEIVDIEKEALKKYPKQWRGTTPSERVAHFDPNEQLRIGYIAGRSKSIEEDKKKDERIKGLEDMMKRIKTLARFGVAMDNDPRNEILKEISEKAKQLLTKKG